MILTIQQAATVLQVSARTVARLVASRRLPHFRVAGRLRFVEAELVEAAKRGKLEVAK